MESISHADNITATQIGLQKLLQYHGWFIQVAGPGNTNNRHVLVRLEAALRIVKEHSASGNWVLTTEEEDEVKGALDEFDVLKDEWYDPSRKWHESGY